MQSNFELEKNQKAGTYTAIICAILLLLFYFITWRIEDVKPPIPEDLIEVNLGNDKEGFGEVQPLIKGEMAPAQDPAPRPQQVAAAKEEPSKDIDADESKDEDAATVKKMEKNNSKKNEAPKENITKPVKVNNPVAVATPAPPKPQKPKATYNGAGNGKGNGATESNDAFGQGNDKNGKGDAGTATGKPDSYGNTPGGKTAGGALRVSKGDRTIQNNYIFMGDLPKATINALIKVSPEGRGTFVGFDKGTTDTDPRYASAIRSYLPNIQFSKSDHESTVTVPFNFKVQ
jgi:outer membrane biosynthesis protein TonB